MHSYCPIQIEIYCGISSNSVLFGFDSRSYFLLCCSLRHRRIEYSNCVIPALFSDNSILRLILNAAIEEAARGLNLITIKYAFEEISDGAIKINLAALFNAVGFFHHNKLSSLNIVKSIVDWARSEPCCTIREVFYQTTIRLSNSSSSNEKTLGLNYFSHCSIG